MRHKNIITQNIWRASYNGIFAMHWTVIGTSYKSNQAIVAPDTGAAINNTSTVTAGISNSRNRLFRHYTPPPILINYSVARIIATIFLLIFYYFQHISQEKSFCLRSYIRFCSPQGQISMEKFRRLQHRERLFTARKQPARRLCQKPQFPLSDFAPFW